MDSQIPLNNKEKYKIKQQERLQERELIQKKKHRNKAIFWILLIVVGIAFVSGVIWLIASGPKTPESDIISRNGFHWHPKLTVYVKGVKQEIPANIGLLTGMNAVHQPIHTHDDSDQGIVHMELQGLVRKQDTTLGQFFKNWGKDMRSFGSAMRMTVNGVENREYEEYVMGDGDRIELRYDK